MALILYYHKVQKSPGPGLWYRNFELQLRLLKSRFKVVPLSEICGALAAGRAPARDQAAITFDDGYADNLVYARPLLKKHGLTAALFPAFSRLRAARGTRPTLEDYWAGKVPFSALHRPLGMGEAMTEHFEKGSSGDFLTFDELEQLSDVFEIGCHASEHTRVFCPAPGAGAPSRGGEIKDLCDGKNAAWTHYYAFGEKPRHGWPLISMKSSLAAARGTLKPEVKDHVRSLDEAYFRRDGWKDFLKKELASRFGEVFSFETEDAKRVRVERELDASKAGLEAVLGRPVRLFSYPFGEHDADLRRAVSNRFSGAVTTKKAAAAAGTDPLLVPRASISDDIFTFAGVLLKYTLGRL